jgi:hypothetical protein
MLELPNSAPPARALTIQRQPPGHAHQPGAKPTAVPQLPEAPKSLDERLLRHIFRVLTLSEDPKRDAKGERGRLGQTRLELTFDIVLHRYEPARQSIDVFVHRFISLRETDVRFM